MEVILVGIVCALLVALVAIALRLNRRGRELALQATRISTLEQRLSEFESRAEEHARKLDESRNKANQAQEELKRARKRLFELEHEKALPAPAAEPEATAATSRLEVETQEARAAARKADEACAQARADLEKARRRIAELEAGLAAAHAAAAAATPAPKPPTAAPDSPADREKLDKTIADLKKKLDAALRKARSDAQVYRVTRSKLDLAMEKIAWLEKKLAPPATPLAPQEAAPKGAPTDPAN